MTTEAGVEKTLFSVLSDLFKARLTFLVLLTTLVGFYAGYDGRVGWVLLINTMVGTALVASGAAALNQFIERKHDTLMERTQDRPLPSGRLQPSTVLVLGSAMSILGLIWLAQLVNPLTSLLGGITLASYLFIYTPLKRVTSFNTVVGAIPGAIPPLMGWAAARNEVTPGGWSLFAILFFWQLPHFYSIAWMYREQYKQAGFVMLPSVDPSGQRTGRQAVSNTLGLMTVSLAPILFGVAGFVYLVGAMVLGAGYLWYAFQFSRHLTLAKARHLFFASILYLPLLLGLMVYDKIK